MVRAVTPWAVPLLVGLGGCSPPAAPHRYQTPTFRGDLPSFTGRRVPKRAPSYLILADVIAEQAMFHLEQPGGTLVGIGTSEGLSAVTPPGRNVHPLSHDRSAGGDVLDCRLARSTVALAELPGVPVDLPETAASRSATFGT
jgi:acetolactate decarboxylase